MSGKDMRKLMEKAVSENSQDYDYEMLLKYIRSLPDANKLKIIYEWVKTDHINFNQFEALVLDIIGSGAEKAIHTYKG